LLFFVVYPPLVVDLDDLQLFLHIEVLFMLKLTNMTIRFFFVIFTINSLSTCMSWHSTIIFFIEMVVLLWNYQKLPSIIIFGNDLSLVAKLIICHYFLIKLFFCLKITIVFWKSSLIVFATNQASTFHLHRVVFLFILFPSLFRWEWMNNLQIILF
jgi:hypothetical protein